MSTHKWEGNSEAGFLDKLPELLASGSLNRLKCYPERHRCVDMNWRFRRLYCRVYGEYDDPISSPSVLGAK